MHILKVWFTIARTHSIENSMYDISNDNNDILSNLMVGTVLYWIHKQILSKMKYVMIVSWWKLDIFQSSYDVISSHLDITYNFDI